MPEFTMLVWDIYSVGEEEDTREFIGQEVCPAEWGEAETLEELENEYGDNIEIEYNERATNEEYWDHRRR